MSERRDNHRTPASSSALLFHPRGPIYPCSIENVSADGMFIRVSNCQIHEGNIIEISIAASSTSEAPQHIKGAVVHKKPSGIGILYIDAMTESA